MVRRALTEEESIKIGTLKESGHSFRDIGQRLGRSISVISRAYTRYQETNSYRRRPGQGRPRCTTPREDRALVRAAVQDRWMTAPQLAARHQNVTGRTISSETVRIILKRAGLRNRRPARGPALTQQQRRNRLAFARNHRGWNRRGWGRVLFSDECRFKLRRCDGRVRVWRRSNERYRQDCIQHRVPFGGGSVMMWAGITRDNRTALVHIPPPGMNAERYITKVVEPHVIPFLEQGAENLIFQQDNARPHVARQTLDFLHAAGITLLDWPANSPDLNPIEHLWDELARRVNEREVVPTTLQQLRVALLEEWDNIPQRTISTLIDSMRNRCALVIEANGGVTRY